MPVNHVMGVLYFLIISFIPSGTSTFELHNIVLIKSTKLHKIFFVRINLKLHCMFLCASTRILQMSPNCTFTFPHFLANVINAIDSQINI